MSFHFHVRLVSNRLSALQRQLHLMRWTMVWIFPPTPQSGPPHGIGLWYRREGIGARLGRSEGLCGRGGRGHRACSATPGACSHKRVRGPPKQVGKLQTHQGAIGSCKARGPKQILFASDGSSVMLSAHSSRRASTVRLFGLFKGRSRAVAVVERNIRKTSIPPFVLSLVPLVLY